MKRMMQWLGLAGLMVLALPAHAAPKQSFDVWLGQFKAKAIEQGISERVVEDAFAGIDEDDRVVSLDRKQPEGKINLTKYLENTVTLRRINLGRDLLREHRDVLEDISEKYQVPPEYIVALWGIETDYGNYTGGFSVIQSLATLAYEGRRHEFFAKELMAALQILESESMAASDFTGSWAGALGNCQFMPSTYLKYAVDYDGDGKRDIWNSLPDTFASIANYVHSLGWNPQVSWGGPVTTKKKISPPKQSFKRGKMTSSWHRQGLVIDPDARVQGDTMLYLIYPGSKERGVFLVTENYKALLQWNRSRYFATAVGTLADAIGEEQ